jgi:hypothetical protein
MLGCKQGTPLSSAVQQNFSRCRGGWHTAAGSGGRIRLQGRELARRRGGWHTAAGSGGCFGHFGLLLRLALLLEPAGDEFIDGRSFPKEGEYIPNVEYFVRDLIA